MDPLPNPSASNSSASTSLAQLAIGQRGRIVEVRGEGEMPLRLLEMGLTPGCEIELLKRAPLGDPLEFRLRGYHLSLRRAEALQVEVLPQ